MPDACVFSYSGVSLLFDHNRQAQRFLDCYLPLQDLVTPPENPARDDWHTNTVGQGRAGLPRPNYPPPPPPRINTLYWPTGAARWARGWFLCDQAGVDVLTSMNDDKSPWKGRQSAAKTLKISTPAVGTDASPYVLEAEMHLLHPLRVTATKDETFGDLWILPLVDQRYWWQFRHCGDLSGSLADWDTLVAAIGTALGVSISCSTVSSYYMVPDPIEICRSYENAAVVLDAVAHSIGRRVVVGYDEEVAIPTYLEASSDLGANRETAADDDHAYMALQAGTELPQENLAPPFPDEVRLIFPAIEDPSDYGAQSFWTSAAEAGDIAFFGGDETIRTTKAVHCAAWAMFQCGAAGTDPANKTNLDALTAQYARDYYGWLGYQYDHAWPGIQEWDPCGYDDHVFFELGTEYVAETEAVAQPYDQSTPDVVMIRDKLARRFMTRVQSMPANFGVSSILCQYEHAIPGVADGLMVKTPSGGIAARDCYDLSSACCRVYHADPAGDGTATLDPVYCDDSNTHWQIRVYNIANAAVSGDALVLTDVLKNGLRVVTVESCATDSCPESSSSS